MPDTRQPVQPYQSTPRSVYTGAPADGRTAERAYRRRLRGVRVRWVTGGLIVGFFFGVFAVLLISALTVRKFPSVAPSAAGEPDVSVLIGENYLNRVAASRINGNYPTGVDPLTLTGLRIDLQPGNRMDLQPSFRIDTFLGSLDTNATVSNQITAANGQMAITMVGDPQIGGLNVPLESLPFNLKDYVRNAVDRVNNSLLIKEINDNLQGTSGTADYDITSVTTTDTALIVLLKHK